LHLVSSCVEALVIVHYRTSVYARPTIALAATTKTTFHL
jgi:hypothetical protein